MSKLQDLAFDSADLLKIRRLGCGLRGGYPCVRCSNSGRRKHFAIDSAAFERECQSTLPLGALSVATAPNLRHGISSEEFG